MTFIRKLQLTSIFITLLTACGRDDSEDKQKHDPSDDDGLRLTEILSSEIGEGKQEEVKARQAQLMREQKELLRNACDVERDEDKCRCISDRWSLFINKKIDLRTYEESVAFGTVPLFDEKGEHIVAHVLCKAVEK
ncbi:MAG: hypothetical protein HYW48_08370 [Deltaproteobacteria bacterium]|nr:hypothetical protein [Deltaproteobacteria bacterium]